MGFSSVAGLKALPVVVSAAGTVRRWRAASHRFDKSEVGGFQEKPGTITLE